MSKLVTIALDDESYEAFKLIPRGSRSKHIRALVVDAQTLAQKEDYIKALLARCRYLTQEKNALSIKVESYESGLIPKGVKE